MDRTGTSISIVLVPVITTFFINFFGLDNSLYGVFFALVNQGFQEVIDKKENILQSLHDPYIKFYIVCGICVYLLYKYRKMLPVDKCKRKIVKNIDNEYLVAEIYEINKLSIFEEYIDFFPEFYSKPTNVCCGDPNLMIQGSNQRVSFLEISGKTNKPINGEIIYFDDTNFEVKGEFSWEACKIIIDQGTKEEKKSTDIAYPYIKLKVLKSSTNDIFKYLEDIRTKVNELKHNHIDLYHVKILNESYEERQSKYIMYSGKTRTLEELERIYMSTFFHPSKEILWNLIKDVQYRPEISHMFGQESRIGLLLHGPSGTGKSTFAYRVAMCLNRHVITVDLRSIKKKSAIYNIIKNPNVGGYGNVTPKDVVFVFDEFDRTVIELAKRQDTKRMIVNTSKNENKTDEKKSEIIENSSEQIYNDNMLYLDDLLELLNGPIPIAGCIIIATTNKYEEIKKLCPPLFRDQRLTPFYFGNPNLETINEISQYYYKRNIEIKEPYNSVVCTASIMEIIKKAKAMNRSSHEEKNNSDAEFNYFNHELQERLNSEGQQQT
jgi:hypothetical protein